MNSKAPILKYFSTYIASIIIFLTSLYFLYFWNTHFSKQSIPTFVIYIICFILGLITIHSAYFIKSKHFALIGYSLFFSAYTLFTQPSELPKQHLILLLAFYTLFFLIITTDPVISRYRYILIGILTISCTIIHPFAIIFTALGLLSTILYYERSKNIIELIMGYIIGVLSSAQLLFIFNKIPSKQYYKELIKIEYLDNLDYLYFYSIAIIFIVIIYALYSILDDKIRFSSIYSKNSFSTLLYYIIAFFAISIISYPNYRFTNLILIVPISLVLFKYTYVMKKRKPLKDIKKSN